VGPAASARVLRRCLPGAMAAWTRGNVYVRRTTPHVDCLDGTVAVRSRSSAAPSLDDLRAERGLHRCSRFGGAPCRPRSARCRPRSPATCGEHGGRGHTTNVEAWISRVPPRPVGRVGRSHAWRRADAHGLGKRQPYAASFGEALQDLLPAPCGGGSERDPAVEIDLLKLNVRRVALCPPCIGQVLLRRVRDGARPQEEDERRDERPSAHVSHGQRSD
jgi:hypothetical protein